MTLISMDIREITDYNLWQSFFEENDSPSFLQSWEWGEVQQKMSYEILRLGIYKNNLLVGISLVIKIKSRRGNFLFIPHGPIFSRQSGIPPVAGQFLISYLKKLAKQENFSFIRIAPIVEDNPSNRKMFEDLSFKTAPIYMHAERTWILDLNKTEQELLNSMRKTTRYLIKRSDRDGVVIEERTGEKAFDDFWRIYKETANREKFIPYSLKYVKSEFEEFNKTKNALFLFGRVKNQTIGPVAAVLILFTKS